MPNFLVRGLPDDVHRVLKRQAAQNGCSLQKEVKAILAKAADEAVDPEVLVAQLHVSDASPAGGTGRQNIYGDGR